MASLVEKAPGRRRPVRPCCCTWICAAALLLLSLSVSAADAQNVQQPASPKQQQPAPQREGEAAIPLTSFSCKGRVPGYYADLETGCQVYHMCAAGSQKFSYRCPNQTLFQQRMMVCDHWFMVDCKTSHLHFAANERLGDKNQPFISSGEKVTRDFVADSFYPLKLESRVQGKAIEPPSTFNSLPSFVLEPRKELLPPAFESFERRVDSGDTATLSSIINRALSPATVSQPPPAPTRAPFVPVSPPRQLPLSLPFGPDASRLRSPTTPPPPPFLPNRTLRPMGLSENTLSVIKASFFSSVPQPVSQSTQSFVPSTTPRPRTTLLDDVLSPSTINSLLQRSPPSSNNKKKPKEHKQLSVALDTRRMFFIPDSPDGVPPPRDPLQRLDLFDFALLPPPPVKPMKFKDHHLHQEAPARDGQCPPNCMPAFFKPGSCQPCVILR